MVHRSLSDQNYPFFFFAVVATDILQHVQPHIISLYDFLTDLFFKNTLTTLFNWKNSLFQFIRSEWFNVSAHSVERLLLNNNSHFGLSITQNNFISSEEKSQSIKVSLHPFWSFKASISFNYTYMKKEWCTFLLNSPFDKKKTIWFGMNVSKWRHHHHYWLNCFFCIWIWLFF